MASHLSPFAFAKAFVSKQKRRYKRDGFNLDLSYITPRIIAMGFPSEGAEGLYRNAMSEVSSFLAKFHKDHFKVFNLCAERYYNPAKFGGSVEWIPFTDHNPAPTEIMYQFCDLAHQWLMVDPENVLVVHCKAGKGRTGMMICAYLLYSKEFRDPVTALEFFAERRTKDGKGVTIPSQKRYICYFNELLLHGPRPVRVLQLLRIIVRSSFSTKRDVHLRVHCNGGNGSYEVGIIIDSGVLFFYFWFNTAFVEGDNYSLKTSTDLDKPKNVGKDTQTEVHFAPMCNETSIARVHAVT